MAHPRTGTRGGREAAGKREPLEIIEGAYLARVVEHFHVHGIFARLLEKSTARDLARATGYDEELLGGLLELLHERTTLLGRTRSGHYRLNPHYGRYYFLGFQVDKFLRAYGPCLERLEESLTSPSLGRSFVDRRVEADAYHLIQSPPNPVVMEIIRERRIRSVVDLGCGPATMLTELALEEPAFRGWGIDESAEMCRVAAERVAAAGVADRVEVVHADARTLAARMPAARRAKVEALQSKSLMNELFRHDTTGAAAYLKALGRLFPGRMLFIVDYYGKLTRRRGIPARYVHTLIHDVIQLVTAQGVPPGDLRAWADVYRKAGCFVEHAYEGDSQGIEWFVHLVRLPEKRR
jgi:SAM-dependent methyltransferase